MSNKIYKPVGEVEKIPKIKIQQTNENDSNDYSEPCCICFQKAIPIMPKPAAIVACVMNIILPGTAFVLEGTLLAAFSILCCNARHKYSRNLIAFLINFLVFLLQLLGSIIIFGWIWSIKYGLLFVHLSSDQNADDLENQANIPISYCRRHSSVDQSTQLYSPSVTRIATAKCLVKVTEDEETS